MERCECSPLKSKFARKSVLVKTKPFNRQTFISINQLFKVLCTGMNTCPQPWPPLINDALLKLGSAFKFFQGSVATLFRWSWNILSYFVANLSKTLHNNFYQDRSGIVEVTTIKFWCFVCLTVYCTRVWSLKFAWLTWLVGRVLHIGTGWDLLSMHHLTWNIQLFVRDGVAYENLYSPQMVELRNNK